MKFLRFFSAFDPFLVTVLFPIPIFGLVMLLSIAPKLFYSQLIFMAIGLIIIVLISYLDDVAIRRLATPAYIISILLIVTLFIFGQVTRGSSRWITLGPLTLQPSELVKPLLIVFFANFFSSHDMQKLRNSLLAIALFSMPFLLIFKEPDLGSALILAIVFLGMLFVSRVRLVYLLIFILAVVAALPFAWKLSHQYQRERIMAFINPNIDPLGKTYNINQAMIAIGSGELFGRGLGQGTQTHLKFLPEYTTDFIYASLGEELGFLGSMMVVVLFSLFFWRAILLSESVHDQFRSEILFGASFLIFAQAFIHVGGNLGILPLTGITLPLISYGGSSVFSTAIVLGLLLSVLRYRKHYHVEQGQIR